MIFIPVYEESSPFEKAVCPCSCSRRQQMKEETRRGIRHHLVDDPLQLLFCHHLSSPVIRDSECKEKSTQEEQCASAVLQEEVRKANEVAVKKDSFNIQVKTTDFKPDEVTVKVKDGELSILAKHEEKDSGNFVYREMHRHFTIPPDVNPDSIIAEMSKNGLLIIKAGTSNGPDEIRPTEEAKEEVTAEVSMQTEENAVSEENVSAGKETVVGAN